MGITTARLSRLRRLAYAQAGRAVLCVVYRRRFHSVSIGTQGLAHGRLALGPLEINDKRTGRPDPAKAEREIVIDLGGPIAVRLANRQRQWRGTGRDLLAAVRAIDLASELSGSHEAARAYLKYLWLRTRDTLEDTDHWAAVQAVAAELIDRRQVSGQRVRRLCRETTGNRGR